LVLLGSSVPARLSPVDVDLELVLAVDVSFSMEVDEQRVNGAAKSGQRAA